MCSRIALLADFASKMADSPWACRFSVWLLVFLALWILNFSLTLTNLILRWSKANLACLNQVSRGRRKTTSTAGLFFTIMFAGKMPRHCVPG